MTISEEPSFLKSSALGISRGIFVHSLIYPLDVVKIRTQNSNEKSSYIARQIFQKEGVKGFYQGLCAQLFKTSSKQLWVWPIITKAPHFLDRYEMNDLQKEACTGLSIAAIDAGITTPLERSKILSASNVKKTPLRDLYKEGWRGFATHLAKLSVNWMTFLTAQKYLRDKERSQAKEKLSLPQLMKIGTEVAVIVSLAASPFDVANTLKHTQSLSFRQILSQRKFSTFYRGLPLSMLGLTIHNIASVTLIERLERSS